MKRLYVFFVITLISVFSYGQDDNYCGWEYAVTANNAVIAIQEANFDNILLDISDFELEEETIPLTSTECPMWIGVFYLDDNGEYACGGYTQWDSSQSMAIAAWGDDPTTSEKDGFSEGEAYILKVCFDELGTMIDDAPNMSTEAPFSDSYATNGFGSIEATLFVPEVFVFSTPSTFCIPSVDLIENSSTNQLVRKMDMFGRDIKEKFPKGIYFEIYSDKSVVKNLGF